MTEHGVRWWAMGWLVLCMAGVSAADLAEVAAQEAERSEGVWTAVKRLDQRLTSRSIFKVAFLLCESGQHLDRLPRLFDVATRMQDRDPESRGFGNFRWKWADGSVLDYNAVEFCMQYGSLIWIRHRDSLNAEVRETLQELLTFSIEGCLRHRVPVSYTNIALMNAENLILLGEALDRPDVFREGRQRLDGFCVYTAEVGIHEFGSPTYYGVDLECLLLLHQFAQDAGVRSQAEALLRLFAEDLAANWYPPASRLGGAHSRDYNYLRGLGLLDQYLAAWGWVEEDILNGPPPLATALADWKPPESLRERNRGTYPRWTQQVWGVGGMQGRSHYATADVSLGTAGANYGAMDIPLTIYFSQPRTAVRTYFIADARRDPYGRKKIPAGGGHEKTLHLKPFWVAVQDRADALALVLYRPQDLPALPPTLESHIVFAADVDGIWIGDREISPDERGAGAIFPLQAGAVLAVRRGQGAFALRIPWSRSVDGSSAPAALVFDGNAEGACRLTVAHHSFWGLNADVAVPGAAFWVRVADGLDSDEAFRRWRSEFAHQSAEATVSDTDLRLSVPGQSSPLTIATAAPYRGCLELSPVAARSPLWVNGNDIGNDILGDLPVVREQQEALGSLEVIKVKPDQGIYWEAESGRVVSPMEVSLAEGAFNSRCVWMPGGPGQKGGGNGTVTWKLDVQQAGTYYLWGRVLAPTPDDDSFYVRVFSEEAEPVGMADWHTGIHENWEWAPVALPGETGEVTGMALPQGEQFLQLRVREDGTKIDRLFLTPREDELP